MKIHRSTLVLFLLFPTFSSAAFSQTTEDHQFVFENFERNYDSLLSQYYMKQNEKRISKRFGKIPAATSLISRASNTPDSVFVSRLNALPTSIPMSYNRYVRSQIEYYIDRLGEQVEIMLGLSKYYFPLFESILDKYNMPLELKNLAVIESALNPLAVSRMGATGLWQFMYSTGRLYDLNINSLIDERKDPLKSTDAAARYLKDLYNIYQDWSLALAAYNCGPGNVNKAIRRSGGKGSFWDIYSFLPRETRGYVPAFIAANYVMSFHAHHDLHPVSLAAPIPTDTVMINYDVHFEQISGVLGVDLALLRDINPQYKTLIIPGTAKSQCLKLPVNKVGSYITMEDSIENYNRFLYFDTSSRLPLIQETTLFHKVRAGETWAKIASRYGVSVSELKNWNGSRSKNPPKGRNLTIYRRKATSTAKPSATTATTATKVENAGGKLTYTVKSGDTVFGIAKKHGVSPASIIENNKLNKEKPVIRTGQSLIIKG